MFRTRHNLEQRLIKFQSLGVDIWYEHQGGMRASYRITNQSGSKNLINEALTLCEAHIFLDGLAVGLDVII